MVSQACVKPRKYVRFFAEGMGTFWLASGQPKQV